MRNIPDIIFYLSVFFITAFIQSPSYCQNNNIGVKRAFEYNNDGSVKSVTVTYSNGESYKNLYGINGEIKEKLLKGGMKISYETIRDNDGKYVTETNHADNIIIKRIFNNKGEIVESKYPEYSEKYEYKYNKVGDIEYITVTKSDGSTSKLNPDDKSLSFLRDYDIIKDSSAPDLRNIRDEEYLYNPTRYKKRMMMHKSGQF